MISSIKKILVHEKQLWAGETDPSEKESKIAAYLFPIWILLAIVMDICIDQYITRFGKPFSIHHLFGLIYFVVIIIIRLHIDEDL